MNCVKPALGSLFGDVPDLDRVVEKAIELQRAYKRGKALDL